MLFCPTCNNVLVFVPECREDGVGQYEFSCQTCGYHHTLTSTVSAKITFDVKQPGDVLGGADAWKNVDATEGKKDIPFLGKKTKRILMTKW